MTNKDRVDDALHMLRQYGGVDGADHKQWLIDQVLYCLTDPEYEEWVADWEVGEDGPHTYKWDTGVEP